MSNVNKICSLCVWEVGGRVLNLKVQITDFFLSPMAFHTAQLVKNLPINAGDPSLIPGSGISLAEGNGYQLRYSCLENPHTPCTEEPGGPQPMWS